MNFLDKWPHGLSYREFLHKYASPEHHRRWDLVHDLVQLTAEQRLVLESFRREMLVLVSVGAWCGDCINQCPILDHFAAATDRIRLRFFDRDDHPDLSDELQTCGGRRVPTVQFLAEDGAPCGRFGDRTLSRYRQIAAEQQGAACPTGLVLPDQADFGIVVQEWLDEFERIQLMLRTSARLRQKHGD